MTFQDLVGKTIIEAKQKKFKKYDDTGFLELSFSDGTKAVIVGDYDATWTGKSYDEYPTRVFIKTEEEIVNRRFYGNVKLVDVETT